MTRAQWLVDRYWEFLMRFPAWVTAVIFAGGAWLLYSTVTTGIDKVMTALGK